LPGGRFVVAWESEDAAGADRNLRARIFNADGSAAGNDFVVGPAATVFPFWEASDIAVLADGRFLITWTSLDLDGSHGVRARLYNADGTAAGRDFSVNALTEGAQGLPQVEALSDGRVFVTWGSEDNGDGSGSCVRAIVFDPDGGGITVDGTPAADLVTGTPFDDDITGGADADRLYAGDGDDTVEGGSGDDLLDGARGADTMTGGLGNDVYVVDDAADQVIEAANAGTDTVRAAISIVLSFYLDHAQAIGVGDVNLTGNFRANLLRGNDGDNVLDGSTGADRMFGGLGNDTYIVDHVDDLVREPGRAVFGEDNVHTSVYQGRLATNVENVVLLGAASFTARGNAGDNDITGNAGNNWVVGERGNDRLVGGAGRDSFVFNTVPDFFDNVDSIVDFSVADDIMRLENSVFTALAAGKLDVDAFHSGTQAGDGQDRIVYDPSTGELFYDGDGSGAEDAVLFAVLPTSLALTRFDFFVT
jgi:Ca2+-binding RTX toxin-like protein